MVIDAKPEGKESVAQKNQTCRFCHGLNNRRGPCCSDACQNYDEELHRITAIRDKKRERSAHVWMKLAGINA